MSKPAYSASEMMIAVAARMLTGARTVFVGSETDTVALPVDRVREVCATDAVRPAHAARLPFATREVELEGAVMPLFTPSEWLATVEGGV